MQWLTADTHFLHRNIIRHCDRPFRTAHHMNQAMVEAWVQRVAPTDTVWFLGDFTMGWSPAAALLLAGLPGRKKLIVGNHDKPFSTNEEKKRIWTEEYLDRGFDEVIHGAARMEHGPLAGVLMSHFPYRGDSREGERHAEHRPVDDGSWLVHGHVHQSWLQRGRMINVGVDAWRGRPVSEVELAEMIAAGERDIPAPPWSEFLPEDYASGKCPNCGFSRLGGNELELWCLSGDCALRTPRLRAAS